MWPPAPQQLYLSALAEAAMHRGGGRPRLQPRFFLPVCWKHSTLKRNFTDPCEACSELHWSSLTWHFPFPWGHIKASIRSCHVGWGSPWESLCMCAAPGVGCQGTHMLSFARGSINFSWDPLGYTSWSTQAASPNIGPSALAVDGLSSD